MKKILAVVLSLAMVLSCVPVFAADDAVKAGQAKGITVLFDGEEMEFDVEPIIEDGRTLVPMRAIFEKFGCAVDYASSSAGKVITAFRGTKAVVMEIGKQEYTVGGKDFVMDVAPKIVDGRTLVPLRAVSESLDARVDWDAATRTITIENEMGQFEVLSTISNSATNSDGKDMIHTAVSVPNICDYGDADFSEINGLYAEMGEKYQDTVDNEENYNDACAQYKLRGADFKPMQFFLSYEINCNSDNYLSITTYDFRDENGAHPYSYMYSQTFRVDPDTDAITMPEAKDIFLLSQEEMDAFVVTEFSYYLRAELGEGFTSDWETALKEKASEVEFYVTDTDVVLYFNTGIVAPYSFSYPQLTYKLD